MNLAEIQALDAQYCMPTFGARTPVCFVEGEGSTLIDSEGKRYLDLFAGIAVNALGYGHPALTSALHAQVDKLLHISNVFYNQPQALLLQALCTATGYDRAFICSTGAEANEGAIKLARKYYYGKGETRHAIVSANNSFHGRTLATVAATGQPKYQAPYKPLPTGFINVPYGEIGTLETAVGETTAAVLLEPIQGEGGVISPPDGYLAQVQTLCRERGVLLICDEVQTGMGRTGKLLNSASSGIQPDIVTLAKGLGGGVPIGAFLARGEVATAFAPGDHGSTFGGNPLVCAAALAVLGVLTSDGFLEEVERKGEKLRALLQAIGSPKIRQVRGAGLLVGVELREDTPAATVQRAMLEGGFVAGTAAMNTVRFAPPLIITDEELVRAAQAFALALS